MKTFENCTFVVNNFCHEPFASGKYKIRYDTNIPSINIRQYIQSKCKDLAKAFWNGMPTTCHIYSEHFGDVMYTEEERIFRR